MVAGTPSRIAALRYRRAMIAAGRRDHTTDRDRLRQQVGERAPAP